MRRFGLSVSVALILTMALPVISHAYRNNIGLDMAFGSGEYTTSSSVADIEMGTFGFMYERYFSDLVTEETPLAMREFTQHPSKLVFGLQSSAMETSYPASPLTLESTEGGFTVGGIFYFPNGTGIGATFGGSSGEDRLKSSSAVLATDETRSNSMTLSVNHYMSDTASVGVLLISAAYELEQDNGDLTEYEDQELGFHGSTLLNNRIWLSGGLRIGSRDIKGGESLDKAGITLEAGFFPIKKLGIFLSAESEKLEGTDYESTEGTSSLTVTYHVSDKLGMSLGFTGYKEDITDAGADSEIEVGIIELGFNMLF